MVHFRFQSTAVLPVGYAWFGAMHTRMDIVLVGPGEELQRELTQQVYDRVKLLDGLLNRFSAGSEVAYVNAKAAREDVHISKDLFYLLEYAQQAFVKTGGLFDITIQSEREDTATGITGSRTSGNRNSQTNPKDSSRFPPLNPQAIVLTRDPLRVRFLHPLLQIDLGGLAKGYAVDQIRNILDGAQVEHYLISFGNSSIAAKGDQPGKKPDDDALKSDPENTGLSSRVGWKIALQNGSASYQLIDECLTVSGNDTQPGGHIIDPRSGKRVHSQSVAVKTNTAIEGEVLSTTHFINH